MEMTESVTDPMTSIGVENVTYVIPSSLYRARYACIERLMQAKRE